MASPVNNSNSPQSVAPLPRREPAQAAPARQAEAAGGKVLPAAAQETGAAAPPASAQLEAAVVTLETYFQSVSRSLRISVDDEAGTTVITVVDQATDEVVRQIPSEEVLALARFMAQQLASLEGEPTRGLLFDGQG
ncbi:flagellar protein FlaG [Haliea atlantica]